VQGHNGAKHVGPVLAVAFSHDGNSLASLGAGDHTVKIWDVLKNTERTTYKDARGPLVWAADNRLVIARQDGWLVMLDAAGQVTKVAQLGAGKLDEVTALAASPSGRTIAAGTSSGLVATWSIDNPHPFEQRIQTEPIIGLVFATEDLVVSATHQTIKTHSLADHGFTDVDAGFPITAIAVNADRIAAACADGKLRLWPLVAINGSRGPARLLLGHRVPVTAVAFSADGKKLLSAADDRLRLWPLEPAPKAPSGPELARWLAARTNVTVSK
jgi:WD40 repeat protein